LTERFSDDEPGGGDARRENDARDDPSHHGRSPTICVPTD
jgi:hypothetical protein